MSTQSMVDVLVKQQSGVVAREFLNKHIDEIQDFEQKLVASQLRKATMQMCSLVEEAVAEAYQKGFEAAQKVKDGVFVDDEIEYIDLGLPSGTLWSKKPIGQFSYHDAQKYSLPTVEQFKELCECRFNNVVKGQKDLYANVLAPNGKTINFVLRQHDTRNKILECRCWLKNGDNPTFGSILPIDCTLGSTNDNMFPGFKYDCWVVKKVEKKVEYIDLGLPSGTKWAKEACQDKVGKEGLAGLKLPSESLFQELIQNCKVGGVIERRGGHAGTLKLVGPNGNFILFNIENHFDAITMEAWDYEHDPSSGAWDFLDHTLPKEVEFWLSDGANIWVAEISNRKQFGSCVVLDESNLDSKLEYRLVE